MATQMCILVCSTFLVVCDSGAEIVKESWMGTRMHFYSFFIVSRGFLLQYNYSAWHLILSGVIKQAHLSAMGDFQGDPRLGKKWFSRLTPQARLYPVLELRMVSFWQQYLSNYVKLYLSCSCVVIKSNTRYPCKGGCANPGNAFDGMYLKHQGDLLL